MFDLELLGPTKVDEKTLGGALFSRDKTYRYLLTRDWEVDGNVIVWIMLNPSVGNDKTLERTTAGCLSRSKAWGFAGMVVLNLFALVNPDPTQLKNTNDPVGEFNDKVISVVDRNAADDTVFVAAWGTQGKYMDRDRQVAGLLSTRDLYCLGINKDGSPKHPLHMSHSIRPELWCGAGDIHLWS